MHALAKTPDWMSLDEFLAWEPNDGQKWQLVDGQPQAMAPTKRTHGAIQIELGRLIGNHLAKHRPHCSVIGDPGIVPRVQSKVNCRIPDLAVTVWTYTTIPSVMEILIVESESVGADLLSRGAVGTWPEKPESVTEGKLYLSSIEFRVPVAAIYRTTRFARAV
jgi:Uma2 family endonuclease